MTDTTAKIRAKGLDATGVTEEIAGQMYRSKGGRYMAIVELEVVEVHEKTDGKRRVDLVLSIVEPSTDPNLDDHLRELTRVLHFNRAVTDGQPALDDDLSPSVTEAIEANRFRHPHPYLASTLSTEDDALCDVCGQTEAAALHNMPTADPFDAEPEAA